MAAVPRKSSASTLTPIRSSRPRRKRSLAVGAARRRAGDHDAREPAAAQPILVVHRGLVDEVGQVPFVLELPRAEVDQILVTDDRQRRVVRGDVHHQPIARGRLRSRGERRVDQVQRRQVDEPRGRAGVGARLHVALDDVAPAERDEILAPAAGDRRRRHPRDLRVLRLERRRLPHLPANQLVEIRRRGNLLEAQERELRRRVGNDQRDAAGPRAQLVERRSGAPPRARARRAR